MGQKKRNATSPGDKFSAPVASDAVVPTGVIPVDDAGTERLRRIAEAAYKRAEQRGFAPGRDLDDWLAAEREIDTRGATRPPP